MNPHMPRQRLDVDPAALAAWTAARLMEAASLCGYYIHGRISQGEYRMAVHALRAWRPAFTAEAQEVPA